MRTLFILATATMPVSAASDARLDSALASVSKIADTAVVARPSQTPTEIGEAASEVLPGNGRRAGYVLGHGNIIPGSEWVYVGVKRARPNVDYVIDYASGSLFFAEPIRQCDSVRVDYRYSEKTKGERSITGPGLMPLRLAGGNLQTNLTYTYRAADPSKGPEGLDVLTYGINSTMSFGGSSSLQSMFYQAAPQVSNRLSLSSSAPQKGQKNAGAGEARKDRLILQNADFGLGGKARLKLGFQQVGEGFAGMQSLREARAAPDDVLNQLEKEKGIKRMSMALEVPTGKTGSLSFTRFTIQDKKDEITSQAFTYAGTSFRFSYLSRDVGKQFTRFKDLREADAAQMAAEAGVRRTNYLLQFRTGADASNSALWSGLNFVRLESENGDLEYRTFDLDTGRVKVQADMRTMDPQFTAMGALTDEERTRMAQIARRQFDPSAQAAQVTAQDKAQINKEAGINRKSCSFQYDGWMLGMGSVELPNGSELNTNRFGFERSWGSVHIYHHRIDPEFDRLAMLQPIEIARFGNETGMNRTDIDGKFRLGFGEIALAHGHVTDHQGASIKRQSIGFKNARLKFLANFQDIDPEFSRINDLSDGDKRLLAKERGFRRSDFSINFNATRYLNIDTYLYNSTNVTAEQTRSQSRHSVTYTPEKGPRFTALSDDFSYVSDEGTIASYSHRRITFDNKFNLLGGLLFKGLSDVNTNQNKGEDPVTTKVTQTHLETSQDARTSYTLDTLTTDCGDGRPFEDSWDLGAKTRVSNKLSLTGGYSKTAREEDKSETNARFGFEWNIRNDLTMGLKIANRDGGPKGSQQAREFTMKGLLARRFLFFNNVTVDSGLNTTDLKGRRVGCDNGLKINAGLFGGKLTFDNSDKLNPKNWIYYTSRVLEYESDKDPKRKYHLTYFRQNLVTPSGEPARKRNYALDMKLSRNTTATLTSFFGRDGKNGAVLPTGGSVYKISHLLGSGSLFADYTTERNQTTGRYARTTGFGFSGNLSNKAIIEFYLGWSRLVENGRLDHDNVFRIKYDHKIDSSRFITLTAQKKSGVDKSSINPFEGNTTARLDFRTVFN